MSRLVKDEFGVLREAAKNRYWEIRFSKFNFLSNGQNWLGRLFWNVSTLITFFPLLLAAGFYGRKLSRAGRDKSKDGILPFKLFTDIYPGCVYSPFVKAYELELFKRCDIKEPILEIGIGDGYFSSQLLKSKKMRILYGADLMYGVLKSARRYGHCDNYVVMDALEIPFPDGSFGTVIMNNLMHHLPNRESAIREILRVLKKGGSLIFTDNMIGWGTFTWEQALLKKMRLDSIADKMLKFKSRLFAQKLLVDENYYEKKSLEMDFDIVQKIPFVSKKAMLLSSLFEFLNLKQGQPTRPEMRRWFHFFGCWEILDRSMADIIKYCYRTDQEQCEREDSAFVFYEIVKTGGDFVAGTFIPVDFACPKCKGVLVKAISSFFCNHCEISFPVFDGIPLFLSYQDKLKGLASYLTVKKEEQTEEYMT
jgi:SAM-dependent methyltransferase